MYDFLKHVFHGKKYKMMQLMLRVIPKTHTMELEGLVELKQYEEMEKGEKRYEGGETRQIVESLEKDKKGEKIAVTVKKEPQGFGGMPSAYQFKLIKNFSSAKELHEEVEKLKHAHILGECIYPITNYVFKDEVEHVDSDD